MIQYYGYTVSPNQIETGEGFLICRNVPIARAGNQEYLGREIGLTGSDAGQVITVRRPPEEVFSDAALASFEGKPVTNDHPPDLIGPDDVSFYEKGHAQVVRRGAGEWQDYVVADLHIHDRELINAIQGGKREISCGYECDYVRDEDGTYSQKNIRGNHIAVVDRGRAGKRAAILDSANKSQQAEKGPERKAMKKNGLFFKLFGMSVKDRSPEEIERLAMDAAAAFDEDGGGADEKPKEEKPEGEKKETADESAVDGIVDKVMARLAAKEAEKEKEKEKTRDAIDAAIEQLTGDSMTAQPAGGSVGGEASRVVPAEEMDNKSGMDSALAVGILKAMRPSVAAIENPEQRKAVSDALISLVTAGNSQDDMAAILKASRQNALRRAEEHKPKAVDTDEIQALYDELNPHRRKESK